MRLFRFGSRYGSVFNIASVVDVLSLYPPSVLLVRVCITCSSQCVIKGDQISHVVGVREIGRYGKACMRAPLFCRCAIYLLLPITPGDSGLGVFCS